jgi:peptidoglycan hydrolase-like protein with peptidoglycan-binding domain
MLLKKGDKNNNVKYLQQGLTIVCINPSGIDGTFGSGTETAVKKFQTKYNLSADGIVGDTTWNVLKDCIIPIQQALNNHGYSLGTPDGVAGSKTYSAVLDFQGKNNLVADGMVGTATKAKLFTTSSSIDSSSVISKGATGTKVKEIQNRLISLGYSCGAAGADGNFGNDTYYAVIAFQKANGLTTDGIVGNATLNALNSSTAVKYSTSTLLKKGSVGDDVVTLQKKLIKLGYSCGAAGADGIFGNDTYYAVIAFQKANGLTPDGIAGALTISKLNNASVVSVPETSVLKKGSSGSDVVILQNRLIELGYSCGSSGADGKFGNGTYNAVISFQSINGLAADGIVGTKTWAVLNSTTAKKYEASSLPTTPPVSYDTNDMAKFAIQVILNGEGNYEAINSSDPISIGIFQWYQERAHDLLVRIRDLNDVQAKSLLTGTTLYSELSQDSSVFSGRYLTSTERSILKNLLATTESHTVQDEVAIEDINAYFEVGKSYGITDEKALIYFTDLYNQSPKQAQIIVSSAGGGSELTLDKIHQYAMLNSVMKEYTDRRNNAYAAISQYTSTNNLESFVNTALGELGYVEGSNNDTKYGSWYGMNNQPWCAMFVSWCANQSGVLQNSSNTNGLVPKYASVYLGMQWYQTQNRFGAKASYKPHYGDILFLKSDGASHTAIVVGYEESSNTLCTVEGNFSDKVAVVCRYVDDTRITGYGINGSNSYGTILENAIWDKGSHSTL